jgi:hypothetical protein
MFPLKPRQGNRCAENWKRTCDFVVSRGCDRVDFLRAMCFARISLMPWPIFIIREFAFDCALRTHGRRPPQKQRIEFIRGIDSTLRCVVLCASSRRTSSLPSKQARFHLWSICDSRTTIV